METFGEYFRLLRKQSGLSQVKLADRAGVARRTIAYWEAGEREPRIPELEMVFAVLKSSTAQRAQAAGLLTASRGVRLARQETQADDIPVLGTLPDVGDFLRTLRVRQGWAVEQLAQELGVTRSTVSRWERGQTIPSEEMLERAAVLLHALPEEQRVLVSRRLSMPEGMQTDWDGCARLLEQVRWGIGTFDPLTELNVLTVKRHLRMLMARDEAKTLPLLVRAEVDHSRLSAQQNRWHAAVQFARRALEMAHGKMVWNRDMIYAINHIAGRFSYEKRRDKALSESLRWLPHVDDPAMRFYLLADMALYSSYLSDHETADRFLRAAGHDAQCTDSEDARDYGRVTQARVLMNQGSPYEAMLQLPAIVPNSDWQSSMHYYWAEAFLAAGERDAAAAQITSGLALTQGTHANNAKEIYERLSRRL